MTTQATRIVIKPQAVQAKPGFWTSQITQKDSTEKAVTALLWNQDIGGKQVILQWSWLITCNYCVAPIKIQALNVFLGYFSNKFLWKHKIGMFHLLLS